MELVDLDKKNLVEFKNIDFYSCFTVSQNKLYMKVGDSTKRDNAFDLLEDKTVSFDAMDKVQPKVITRIEYKSK